MSYEIDLTAVRADGWFEAVGAQMEGFRAICDIVGERFLAFSMIAGVRLTGIMVDSVHPSESLVEFLAGEDETKTQQLALGDFRRRLVEALLAADPPQPEPFAEMPRDDVARLVGGRYLLLAPLYGVRLLRLVVDPERRDADLEPDVVCEEDGEEATLPLSDLQERLRQAVRRELVRASEGPFALDLSRVEPALEALAKGDAERVIELIGSWPGPLSLFLRTPAGAGISARERERIGEGLAVLGEAYRRVGRGPWAEEIFRLGLQYVTEGRVAAQLFRRIGDAMAAEDRPGEAIAPYRRALVLGGDDPAVLVPLGRAFAARGRHVAAIECFRAALGVGAEIAVREDLDRSLVALGAAGEEWRARLGG